MPGLDSLAGDPFLSSALAEARARRLRAWVVGGAVRDAWLGRPVKDLDLVVDTGAPGEVLALARAVADRLGGSFVPLDEERGIARIVLREGRDLDLAARSGGGLEEDLRRRDFTVNAMAWDPVSGERRDPTGGERDLEQGILRPAGPSSLVDDPLRLLRALRMLCSLPVRPAPGLEEDLRRHAPLLLGVSFERIRDELFACFRAGLSPWWDLLVGTGMLPVLLPELDGALLSRAGASLRLLEGWEAAGFPEMADQAGRLREHLARPLVGPRTAGQLLKFMLLLERLEGPTAEAIGRRFVLSNREIRFLLAARTLQREVLELASRDASAGEVHRMFRAAGKAAPEFLVLAAVAGGDQERRQGLLPFLRDMLVEFFQEGRVARPKVPVTGAELMSAFRLPRGPGVGRLLERLAEAVADGTVRSRDEAMALAAEWLSSTDA